MKPIITSIVSLLWLVCSLAPVVQAETPFGSCEEILAIPVDIFVVLNGNSDSELRESAIAWAACQQDANDLLLEKLPEAESLRELRELAFDAADAWLGFQYTRWQGGSLYGMLRAQQQPEIELWLKTLIKLLQAEQDKLSVEWLAEEVDWYWLRLKADLAMLVEHQSGRKLQELAAEVGADRDLFQADWETSVANYSMVLGRLEELLGERRDIWAYLILKHFVEEAEFQLELLAIAAG